MCPNSWSSTASSCLSTWHSWRTIRSPPSVHLARSSPWQILNRVSSNWRNDTHPTTTVEERRVFSRLVKRPLARYSFHGETSESACIESGRTFRRIESHSIDFSDKLSGEANGLAASIINSSGRHKGSRVFLKDSQVAWTDTALPATWQANARVR